MKKISNAVLLLVMLLFSLSVYSQENKHIVSIATGFGLSIENSLYIDFDDPDFEIWSEPKNNLTFTAAYEYRLNDYIRMGGQIEFEKINFESYYTGEASANRAAFGLTSFSQFPKTAFHMELAGFFNFATASSDEFDNNLAGFEYGLMTGPVYEIGDFSVGLYFKPQFSYYFSDSQAPSSALIMYPRIVVRVGYSF